MAAEGKVPLLEEVYYENCSGCRIEKRKRTQQSVPLKTLFSVWVIVLSSALPISSLFPFLYFMIRDFHIAKREEDTSYYAGYVGSAFMFGRALTSVFWGVVADRYGRKPVIIIGTFAVVVFNTLFGLSVNFWMAIISRFLLGSLNGLLGPIKAYATEVCRDEHQALGLSTISTAWSIGLIIGPALGGLLAQPAEKYPNIFSKESLFGRFPYFLPCLCISVFALGVSFSTFWLEESLHNHPVKTLHDDSYDAMEAATCQSTSKKSLLKNWPLMSSIMVYCIFSLVDMAYGEIFSLWAVSPRSLGGLSYSTNDVGEILSVTGFGMLVYQFFGYPLMDRVCGPINTARMASILSIPVLQSYPFIGLLSGLSLTVTLNCASVIKNILATSIITSMFILQNRAVDQDQRGAANGIAMTAFLGTNASKRLFPSRYSHGVLSAERNPVHRIFIDIQAIPCAMIQELMTGNLIELKWLHVKLEKGKEKEMIQPPGKKVNSNERWVYIKKKRFMNRENVFLIIE
ncbi:hypothetical protein V2J09_013531 [Rumex salicifolius]